MSITLKPKTVCKNLKDEEYNLTDLTSIFGELPLQVKVKNRTNPDITRANYSSRLIRGVMLWSVLGLIASAIIALVYTKSAIPQFSVLGLICILSVGAWVGMEASYHRKATYDSVMFLLAGDKSEELCKRIDVFSNK